MTMASEHLNQPVTCTITFYTIMSPSCATFHPLSVTQGNTDANYPHKWVMGAFVHKLKSRAACYEPALPMERAAMLSCVDLHGGGGPAG